MFRVLIAHPQEAINKRHLVYCVRVMSVQLAVPEFKLNWLSPTPVLTSHLQSRCDLEFISLLPKDEVLVGCCVNFRSLSEIQMARLGS
jgi:hypothetical protein